MNNKFDWRLIVGIALIGLGAVSMMQVLGVLPSSGNLVAAIFGVLFLAGGLAFLSVLRVDRAQWWAAIPGTILSFLGLMILMESFIPRLPGEFAGAFFMAGISLAFWVVLFLNREQWWAVIPGGVLLSIALMIAFFGIFPEWEGVGIGILFLGMGATFCSLALLPLANGRRQSWGWIPGGILAGMGVISMAASVEVMGYLMPVLLIVGGAALLFGNRRNPNAL